MKRGNTVSRGLWAVCLLPAALVLCLFLILYTPVDWVRYRASRHRREMRERYGKGARYTWLATLTWPFRVFELISRNGLPIRYYRDTRQKPCTAGFFCYEGTLLVVDVFPRYDTETGHWYVSQKLDPHDARAYLEGEMEELTVFMDGNLSFSCERAVFLVPERELGRAERARWRETDFILPYNKRDFVRQVMGFFGEG